MLEYLGIFLGIQVFTFGQAFKYSSNKLTIMEHQKLSIQSYCELAQLALSGNKYVLASDIINVIRYRGENYAEIVYNRIEEDLNKLNKLV